MKPESLSLPLVGGRGGPWESGVLQILNDIQDMRKKAFIKKLKTEVRRWADLGIIDGSTAEKISVLYTGKETDKNAVSRRIPAILIGFAVTLLGVGIILFYAANWKAMHPRVKLGHVFFMILLVNGLAYYFLATGKSLLMGRGMLVLGMVFFGAGIMLVAQIFHISSHPANGILTWSLGVIAMSWIMKERFGYYLALLLVFIWNSWEVSVYGNPNYVLIIFTGFFIFFLYEIEERKGLVGATLFTYFSFFQAVGYWLRGLDSDASIVIFVLIIFPFAAVILIITRILFSNRVLAPAMKLNYIISLLLLAVPFAVINWNVKMKELFPILGFSAYKISILYILLLLAGGGLFFRYLRREGRRLLSLSLLAAALLFMVLPLGNGTVLMVAVHLVLVFLIFIVLYNSFLPGSTPLERSMAFIFTALLAAAKGGGLLIMGGMKREYAVAYGISSVIYLTVLFLVNQLVYHLMKQREVPYNRNVINGVTAFMGYWVLYFLSFKLEKDQLSIFGADFIVIVMVLLFISIAVGLYVYLLARTREKVPVYISASVFFTSVAVLLISGPWLNRNIHTIVFNILLFVMTGALIYYALHINSTLLANIAIAGFVIHILTRYFDVFWDLLSGSLFIIVTGLLLLAAGFVLEKSRKKIIEEIEKHTEEGAK